MATTKLKNGILGDNTSSNADYKSALAELQKLTIAQSSANKEYDYNHFLFTELAEADFNKGEISFDASLFDSRVI